MKNTLHKAARCLLFTILATVTPLARSVVYVDGAAAGLENGTSWANAYKDLRIAMAASPANAEIWVAAGVYKPGPSRADSFVLKPGMKLYGGFTSGMTARDQRDWTANPTTLSGDINTLNTHTDNSDHILIGAADAVVDGFTIERGGDSTYASGKLGDGGGLLVEGIGTQKITVANCIFQNNSYFSAPIGMNLENSDCGRGGAIFAATSAVDVVNCTFIGNQSHDRGGAICVVNPPVAPYRLHVSNSVFRSSSTMMTDRYTWDAKWGAVTNADGTLVHPWKEGNCGGADIFASGEMLIVDSVFTQARTCINDYHLSYGGSICISVRDGDADAYNTMGGAIVRGCKFLSNDGGPSQGGAIFAGHDITLERCVFAGNRATRGDGGALYVGEGATATARGCTFVGNFASYFPRGSDYSSGRGSHVASKGRFLANNCLFAGGYSISTTLGGVFAQLPGWGGSILSNCTISGASARFGGAFSIADVTNEIQVANGIVWKNHATNNWVSGEASNVVGNLICHDLEIHGGDLAFRYTDIRGGWTGGGSGNLDVDPLYAGGGSGTWTAVSGFDAASCTFTLTDSTQTWTPGELAGLFVDVNTTTPLYPEYANAAVGDSEKIVLDPNIATHQYLIKGNTSTTMTVYGKNALQMFGHGNTVTFASVGSGYRIHDYHLKAKGGRWTPRTPVTGRWTVDDVDSPCLHQGDPASDYSLEPYPNGSRIDMGAYGNTEQASKRVAASMMLLR